MLFSDVSFVKGKPVGACKILLVSGCRGCSVAVRSIPGWC
jgi:hypothetical protein